VNASGTFFPPVLVDVSTVWKRWSCWNYFLMLQKQFDSFSSFFDSVRILSVHPVVYQTMTCHILLQIFIYYRYSEIILVFIAPHTSHCLLLVSTETMILLLKMCMWKNHALNVTWNVQPSLSEGFYNRETNIWLHNCWCLLSTSRKVNRA
jgi:hypothetical protein